MVVTPPRREETWQFCRVFNVGVIGDKNQILAASD